MSRCLRFPPPGYVWKGVSGEALIELIKVRRDGAKAEKWKKKEKRRRRREMEEELEEGEIRHKSHSHHKGHKYHGSKNGGERSDYHVKKKHELYGLERSSLTAELGQPVIPDSLNGSSDNSQNVKRKSPSWYPESCHSHGSIIWIDIQLQEQKDQKLPFGKPMCSITKMDLVVQEKSELAHSYIKEHFSSTYGESKPIMEQFFSTNGTSATTALELARPFEELCHSFSKIDAIKDEKFILPLKSSYSESGLQHIESKFTELTVNWVPPPMNSEHLEFENLEWLFETRNKRFPRSEMIEKSNAKNDNLSHSSSAIYPTAQYFPLADIYALPFTLPF